MAGVTSVAPVLLALQQRLQLGYLVLQFSLTLTIELGDQQTVGTAVEESLQQAGVFGHLAAEGKTKIVQQLDRGRIGLAE